MKAVTDPTVLAQLDGGQPVDEETARMLEQRRIGEQAFRALPPAQQVGHGAIKSATESAYGVQDLLAKAGGAPLPWGGRLPVSRLSGEQQDKLEQLQAVQGPYATMGELGTDVAMMAIPGAGIEATAGKLLTKAPRLVRALGRYGTTVGTAAGEEGLKAPVADRSRADRAKAAAIGAGVAVPGFAAGGRMLRRALAGKQNDVAQELVERGIPVTIGRGDGPIRQGVENLMENVPFVGKQIERRVAESMSAWNRDLLQQLNPLDGDSYRITQHGEEGFDALQKNFSKAYDDVWRDTNPERVFERFDVRDLTTEIPRKVPADEQAEVMRILSNADSELTRALDDPKALQRVDDIFAARGNRLSNEASDYLAQFRQRYHNALPRGRGAKLKAIDQKYRNLVTLQRAQSYKGAQETGIFSPGDLLGAAKARTPDRQMAAGNTDIGGVDLAKQAIETGSVLGQQLPHKKVLRKALGGASTLGGLGLAGVMGGPLGLVTGGLGLGAGRTLYGKGLQSLLTNPKAHQKGLASALRGLGYTGGSINDMMEEDELR